jgi:ribonuclease R
LIPIRSLGTEYFNYDESRHALVGTRSGTMHQLGDVVDVRLIEAAPIAGALRFELLSSSSETAPRDRRRSGPQRRPSFNAHPGRSPDKKRKPPKPKPGKKGKNKNKGKGKGQKGKAW